MRSRSVNGVTFWNCGSSIGANAGGVGSHTPGAGVGRERIRCAVPVVRARLEDDVADCASECHAGVLGATVRNG